MCLKRYNWSIKFWGAAWWIRCFQSEGDFLLEPRNWWGWWGAKMETSWDGGTLRWWYWWRCATSEVEVVKRWWRLNETDKMKAFKLWRYGWLGKKGDVLSLCWTRLISGLSLSLVDVYDSPPDWSFITATQMWGSAALCGTQYKFDQYLNYIVWNGFFFFEQNVFWLQY